MRINQSITDFFLCKLEVRQGCLISLRLFIIFINELEKEQKNSNCKGISLASAVRIFLLMYADNIALIADTSIELQRKLKALESVCQKLGTEVNLAKPKVIVFGNGGKLRKKSFYTMGRQLIYSKNPHKRTLNFQIRLIQVLNLRLQIKYQGVRFLKSSYCMRYNSS